MSIVIGILVVLGLVGFAVYALSNTTARRRDPDDQPDVSGDQPVAAGQPPRAPGGHPMPGVGPDGRP